MDILLQQARTEYTPLLDLTEPLHRAYAERHGLSYMRFDGPYAVEWTGHWDAIWLLDRLLACAWVDRVFWLDADTLITGDEDLRAALGGRLAMCRHPGPPPHWNCGVLFLRNGPRMREWIHEIWRRGPGEWPWYQQQIMNDLLAEERWNEMVERLDDRWNSTYRVTAVDEAVIRAWHGVLGPDAKLARMQAHLAEMERA